MDHEEFPDAPHNVRNGFDIDTDLDWMLMADAQFLPDTCA
jgi:hypothetical protein